MAARGEDLITACAVMPEAEMAELEDAVSTPSVRILMRVSFLITFEGADRSRLP